MRLDPDSPRAANYVKNNQVADKIKAAKLPGDFEAITVPPDMPAYWLRRFAW